MENTIIVVYNFLDIFKLKLARFFRKVLRPATYNHLTFSECQNQLYNIFLFCFYEKCIFYNIFFLSELAINDFIRKS